MAPTVVKILAASSLPFLRSRSSHAQYRGALVVVVCRVKRASVFVSCRVSAIERKMKNGACVGKKECEKCEERQRKGA